MHVAPRKLFENVIVVQYIGLVGVTLLTLFGFQAAFGNVLTGANLEVLAMNMVFEGIMALGMTFVIIMGGIDLSVASVFAFSEILVAKLMVQAGFAIVPAILVTLLAAAAIGALNGVLIVLFRVHPLVITMGTLLTLRGSQSRDHRRSFRFRVSRTRFSSSARARFSGSTSPSFSSPSPRSSSASCSGIIGSFASSISLAAANEPRVCPASTSAGSRSSSTCFRRFSPDAPELWLPPNMARPIGRTGISPNSKPSLRSQSAAPTSTAAAEQSEGRSSGSYSWPSSTTPSLPRR